MKQHITVTPSDQLIIVDGKMLNFTFSAPKNMHALQWHEGTGHIEWVDRVNQPLAKKDYTETVAPYVTLWEREYARRQEEKNKPPTLEEARESKLAVLRNHTHTTITAGFSYTLYGIPYHFNYDEEDQGNFAKASAAALHATTTGDTSFRQPWRCWYDTSPHIFSLTAEEFLALAQAGGEHQLWHQQRHWKKEAAITAASSLEELDAITL